MIREACKNDLEAVHELIRELAEYERAPGEVTLSHEQLKADFTDAKPDFHGLVADDAGRIIGMALYFYTYSTWKGRCLYLEDMIVTENYRGRGHGKQLFEKLIQIAAEANAQRMMWQVLDWNEPAIRFYRKYNADLDPEWVNGKFTREQIEQMAKQN